MRIDDFDFISYLGLFKSVYENNGKFYVINDQNRVIEISEEFVQAMIKEGKRVKDGYGCIGNKRN